MEITATDLEKFKEAVQFHDLTYDYSDDHQKWKRGFEQKQAIRAMAAKLPHEEVVAIWNANVDQRIADFAREQFYWKG